MLEKSKLIGILIPIVILGYFTSLNFNRAIIEDEKVDISTLSNFNEITTEHIHLDLNVNFEIESLHGAVTLNMRAIKPNVQKV